MEKDIYEAIKMKLEQDRMEVEREISLLQGKKMEPIKKKQIELNKLTYTTKILQEKKIINAAMLSSRFNPEVLKKCENEIRLIDKLIAEQYVELEKIREQEKYLDSVFEQKLKEMQKIERRKEEELLFDYKHWSDF